MAKPNTLARVVCMKWQDGSASNTTTKRVTDYTFAFQAIVLQGISIRTHASVLWGTTVYLGCRQAKVFTASVCHVLIFAPVFPCGWKSFQTQVSQDGLQFLTKQQRLRPTYYLKQLLCLSWLSTSDRVMKALQECRTHYPFQDIRCSR